MNKKNNISSKQISLSKANKLLREKAELIAHRKMVAKPVAITELSTQQIDDLIHELSVFQIELEIQNENLLMAYEQLEVSRKRYIQLYNLAPVGYLSLSNHGIIRQANTTSSKLLACPVSMLQQLPFAKFICHEDTDKFYLFCKKIINTLKPQVCELKMNRHDNTSFWGYLVAASTVDEQGEQIFFLVLTDSTELHNHVDEIRRLAFFDQLTGLPNRRLLLDRLNHAIISANRNGKFGALMMLDLDNFKQLNDTRGHADGDLLLQQIARLLQGCVRKNDSVGRLGGDEFVILLEGLSENAAEAGSEALHIAKKIQHEFSHPFRLHDYTHNITASIGITIFMQLTENVDKLLKNADLAMYQAKAAGCNKTRFFDAPMQAMTDAREQIEDDLHRALKEHEFVLYYQTQVNNEGEVTGVEALIRWAHPLRGMLVADDFIAQAEESQLILPLGKWVLETACKQLKAWAEQPITRQWTIAVNVSAMQFLQSDFVDILADIIKCSGAAPHLLKLELTESMLIDDVENIIAKMNVIKKMGVKFSLDDFGTGYSSLSYLKRLPLEQLKIDQSFVHDLLVNENDAAICKTIIALGHSLDLQVIAEGVEDVEHRDLLANLGCNAYQGYYFGSAIPANELIM
ncbi:MAG: diguanylate cyclase (GGDEF)-like protein [Psychromonas sp.]|jgi:diguanylate cyclase (GGDEF)-like protein|uniref:EAL domain-containing protein n=1 Tax=Psychromonas sp. TaxID=1884585 RepID=UPI0039E415F1